MSLAITTITNSIAALSVSGVVIKDVDEIPYASDQRTPTIAPWPAGFISGFSVERDSFGGGSTAKMTVTYTLLYRMYYCPIGDGRTNLLAEYAGMLTKIGLWLDAVLAIDAFTGAIDVVPLSPGAIGPVEDPSGVMFLGCDLPVQVQEFVN